MPQSVVVFFGFVQKDDPEEDMDTRGGGQAADDRRIVKDEDYASDNDADFMEEREPLQAQQQQAQHAQQAQQQSGYQDTSRPGTPGRGSVVSHLTPGYGLRVNPLIYLHLCIVFCTLRLIFNFCLRIHIPGAGSMLCAACIRTRVLICWVAL